MMRDHGTQHLSTGKAPRSWRLRRPGRGADRVGAGAGHHGPMADPDLTPDLIRRARAAGIAPSYRDSHREELTVSAETLTAILGALGPAAAAAAAGDGGTGQRSAAAPVPEEV